LDKNRQKEAQLNRRKKQRAIAAVLFVVARLLQIRDLCKS